MRAVKHFTMLVFLFLGISSYAQTGVVITFYDGTTQNYNVTSTGKLYFDSDNLFVKIDGTANSTSIPVTIIKKIIFSETLSNNILGDNKHNMVLYPNPSSDLIKIKSQIQEELDVKIYSLTGQLVLRGVYQSDEDIDVSQISSGLYLVQVNGLTIKFSKK